MENLKHQMVLNNFFADEQFREGTLEIIIDKVKTEMLEKLYFDRLKGKEKDNFIISFHNTYWDDFRINEEIDKYLRITNGLYKNPINHRTYIDRAEAYQMITNKKPFDIILVVQTQEEFVKKLYEARVIK